MDECEAYIVQCFYSRKALCKCSSFTISMMTVYHTQDNHPVMTVIGAPSPLVILMMIQGKEPESEEDLEKIISLKDLKFLLLLSLCGLHTGLWLWNSRILWSQYVNITLCEYNNVTIDLIISVCMYFSISVFWALECFCLPFLTVTHLVFCFLLQFLWWQWAQPQRSPACSHSSIGARRTMTAPLITKFTYGVPTPTITKAIGDIVTVSA